MRKPNLRFLAIWTGVCVLLVVSAHFVHGYQAKRTAGILLLKARELRDGDNLRGAVDYYQRYLTFMPGDTDALGEYGLTLARLPGGASADSLQILEQVLRRDPNYPNARRTLVEVAVANRLYADAKAHLVKENAGDGHDGHLCELLAICQESEKDYVDAEKSFRQAIDKLPNDLNCYMGLATLLREHMKRPNDADQTVILMVTKNPTSGDAYFLRGHYWRNNSDLQQAVTDAKKATEISPQQVDYLLFAAAVTNESGDFDQAQKYITAARQLDAKKPELYLILSALNLHESSDKAIAALREGLAALPDNKALLWQLANLQIDQSDYSAAHETTARLAEVTKDADLTEYLAGRISLLQGDVLTATSHFERVQGNLSDRKDLQKQAYYWLGICYDRSGQLDHRIEAYRNASNDDPAWQPALIGLATALAEAGRIDEAIDDYEQLLAVRQAPAMCYQEMARLLVLQQLRRPSAARDWHRAAQAVEHAAQTSPNSSAPVILSAEIAVAQGRNDDAVSSLDTACHNQPDAAALWVARAALAVHLGHFDAAESVLQQAQTKLGDRAEIRLERIRETLQLSRAEAEKRLAELAAGWDQYSSDEKFLLSRQLASAYAVFGAFDKAESYWTAAITARPEWLPGYLFLFDTAASRNDQVCLETTLDGIRRIEKRADFKNSDTGSSNSPSDELSHTDTHAGPLWCYGEAARQILLAGSSDHAHLASARKLLEQALVERPRWSRAFAALGEVERRDGNFAAATERYMTALELGERSPALIRNVVALLYQRQRFADADRVLRQLEEQQGPFSSELSRVASEVSWRVEDYGRALELAKTAAAGSKDIDDHLWLGQLLTLMHQPAEAEQAFRHATELMPSEQRTWLALVQHWIRQFEELQQQIPTIPPEQIQLAREQATRNIEDMLRGAAEKLSAEQIALLRAQAMEALGNPQVADAEYRRALQLKPSDSHVLSQVGAYFLRIHSQEEAETVFRNLLQPSVECTKDEAANARRQLALLIVGSGRIGKMTEALTLVEQNLQLQSTDEDWRIKAIVLSTLPGQDQAGRSNRAVGIEIVEQLIKRGSNSADDRFLLAQMYEADANKSGISPKESWPRNRKLLLSLATEDGASSQFIAAYIHGLIMHHELDEAEIWLERLETQKPQDAANVELRAQFAVAKWHPDEALAIVQKQAAEMAGIPGRKWCAKVLVRLIQQCQLQMDELTAAEAGVHRSAAEPLIDAAQQLYLEVCKDDPSQRGAAVAFLAHQGRISAALDLCHAWSASSGSTEGLVAAAVITTLPDATADERVRVETEILQQLKTNPNTPRLATALGTIYESQSRIEEAISAYRQALKVDNQDVVALNNLALLLAYRDEPREALPLVDQAIQTAGPLASLRDSRGTVLMAMGKADDAIAEFTASLANEATGPHWYHLAQAQWRLQHKDQARQAFQHAQELKLNVDQLHVLEKADYQRLVSQLSS